MIWDPTRVNENRKRVGSSPNRGEFRKESGLLCTAARDVETQHPKRYDIDTARLDNRGAASRRPPRALKIQTVFIAA